MDEEKIYVRQKEYLESLDKKRKLREERAERENLLFKFRHPEKQKEILEKLLTDIEYFEKVKEYVKRNEGFRGQQRFLNNPPEYMTKYFYDKFVPEMQKKYIETIKEIDEELSYVNRFALDKFSLPPPSYESMFSSINFNPYDKKDKDDNEDTGAGIGA